jgi:hypothetical protein
MPLAASFLVSPCRQASSWFPFASTVASPSDASSSSLQPQDANLPPTDYPESNFIKVIRKEMEDEEYRDDKLPPEIPVGWTIKHEEGTAFFTMTRQWKRVGAAGLLRKKKTVSSAAETNEESSKASSSSSSGSEMKLSEEQQHKSKEGFSDEEEVVYETHFVRSVIATRDTSLDPEVDLRGEHFPFNIIITCPALASSCIDVSCDVVEGELRFDSLQSYSSELLGKDLSLAAAFDRAGLYPGPSLDETEEEVLDGLQAYMAERGFDDQFGEFVAQYTCWIEQLEYERWLANLKSFVEA